MSYDVLLEALLFYRASPVSKKQVASALGLTVDELPSHITTLRERLNAGGTAVVETDQDLQLVTSPSVSSFIDAVRRDELRTDIGKAGAETLAIILYKEPASRAEIDQIRGVNSSVTLRNLQTRGLIERRTDRSSNHHVYGITPQLLSHLGVTQKQELPHYSAILDRIETFTTETTSET